MASRFKSKLYILLSHSPQTAHCDQKLYVLELYTIRFIRWLLSCAAVCSTCLCFRPLRLNEACAPHDLLPLAKVVIIAAIIPYQGRRSPRAARPPPLQRKTKHQGNLQAIRSPFRSAGNNTHWSPPNPTSALPFALGHQSWPSVDPQKWPSDETRAQSAWTRKR